MFVLPALMIRLCQTRKRLILVLLKSFENGIFTFDMKNRILSILIFLICFDARAQEYFMLVGTYDSPQSEGIYVYKFNTSTGFAKEISHIKTSNPSFIAISPDEKYVYAVHETAPQDGKGGDIAAFAFNKQNGMLTFINRQLSGGDHPCHVEVDKTGKWLFASNYSSGTLSVLPVNSDGSLGKAYTIQHSGSGPFPERQKGPHVHGAIISSDNKQLFVTDLGIDKIMMYDFDASTGKLSPSEMPFVQSAPGSGPRLLTFQPDQKMAYVVEELSGSISAYNYDRKTLKEAWPKISLRDKGDTSFPGSADVHISADGKFLYASNRGDINNIVVYELFPGQRMHWVQYQSVLGKTPRNFSIDPSGHFLLAENQNSNEIVIFKRNTNNGKLKDSKKRISIGKPVCIKWIRTK